MSPDRRPAFEIADNCTRCSTRSCTLVKGTGLDKPGAMDEYVAGLKSLVEGKDPKPRLERLFDAYDGVPFAGGKLTDLNLRVEFPTTPQSADEAQAEPCTYDTNCGML